MTPATRVTAASLKAHGETTALEGRASTIGYRIFAGRANAVADLLREMQVAAGERVAILSRGRGHDEPVALAGIHLHGASAVPLDPTAPPKRQAAILARSGCRALIHDAAATAEAGGYKGLGRIELDEDGFVLASIGSPFDREDEDVAESTRAPDEGEAMLLHTSGSTAEPKAIPIRWEGVDAFVTWMVGLTKTRAQSRILRVAELCFDLSLFDHLAAWHTGATLCTMSRQAHATARSLADGVAALNPTIAYAVPSWWMRLCDGSRDTALPASFESICFAGEAFPPAALSRLASMAPRAALFNLFGPTETNVCCFWPVDRARLDGASDIPIGAPCPYATCEIASDGELIVSGPTALDRDGTRTGDRVERSASGELLFRGRLDRMLKIAGHRVDPGEIETLLRSHVAVMEAAVVGREQPRLGLRLEAFVTARSAASPDPAALRKHLAEQLPSAIVPDAIHVVAALPRTANGKIDYRSLGEEAR